ncbi:MAG: membrane protein of unknown function [Promethearchaeota archaeon]|nr:MAG: membrane protein of unknown function [Candidatus Lokiarchaeota archaeon]
MILVVLFVSLSVILLVIGLYYIIANRVRYIIQITDVLLLSFYLFVEVAYFILFTIAFEGSISEETAYLFWVSSVILWIFKLSIPSSVMVYTLIRKKIRIVPIFLFSILGGIIGTYLLFSPSFQSAIIDNQYAYFLSDELLLTLNFFYNGLAMFITIFTLLKGYNKISFQMMKNLLILLTILYNINIILYLGFLLNPEYFFLRLIYLFSILLFYIVEIFIVIARFDLFVVVTNEIYDFIIFHRSGVLLFSYNLARNEEIDESVLKGSILIGINHILSNFINKKNMLNLIKMKNGDIIFEYNKEYGYAILTIVKHKNKIIEKAVQLYMEKFAEEYSTILNKINKNSQLIDTSEFKNAKQLLYNYFKPFMV